jgi:hypothetical protein
MAAAHISETFVNYQANDDDDDDDNNNMILLLLLFHSIQIYSHANSAARGPPTETAQAYIYMEEEPTT